MHYHRPVCMIPPRLGIPNPYKYSVPFLFKGQIRLFTVLSFLNHYEACLNENFTMVRIKSQIF